MWMLKYIVVSIMVYRKQQRTFTVKAIYLGVMKWDENQRTVAFHCIQFQLGIPEWKNQWTFFERKKK